MAVHFQIDSRTVTADTPRELAEFLQQYNPPQPPTVSEEQPPVIVPVQPPPLTGQQTSKALRKVYGALPKHGKHVIDALWKTEQGLTDVDLRKILGVQKMALAGVMSGIAKNGKAHGIRFGDILLKEDKSGPGGAKYLYRLTPDMRNSRRMRRKPATPPNSG